MCICSTWMLDNHRCSGWASPQCSGHVNQLLSNSLTHSECSSFLQVTFTSKPFIHSWQFVVRHHGNVLQVQCPQTQPMHQSWCRVSNTRQKLVQQAAQVGCNTKPAENEECSSVMNLGT